MRVSDFLVTLACLAISSYGEEHPKCSIFGGGCRWEEDCCGKMECLSYGPTQSCMCARWTDDCDPHSTTPKAPKANGMAN